jgi:hypothetical protein
MDEAKRSKIIVRGSNILTAPLLISDDASVIEFRDPFDELVALMVKVLSDDMWGLVTKNDPDWQATLVRCGYLNAGKPMDEIIRSGL